mgnify:CR=1 FL=1
MQMPKDTSFSRANFMRLYSAPRPELDWLEEPVWPPDDARGLAAVRRAETPIAADENTGGEQGFAALFDHGAVDVAQPSVAKVGGISALLRVIALAERHQVKVVPHCFYYGVGLLGTAHIVAALPDEIQLEVPFIRFTSLLYPQLAFTPRLTLPDLPGLGFTPDAQVMKNHTVSHVRITSEGSRDV